eukprot:2503222-Rhodomonas_salina.1
MRWPSTAYLTEGEKEQGSAEAGVVRVERRLRGEDTEWTAGREGDEERRAKDGGGGRGGGKASSRCPIGRMQPAEEGSTRGRQERDRREERSKGRREEQRGW